MKHNPEPAIPLPIIQDEKSPVSKELSMSVCIARREWARILNGQPEQYLDEMEKLLLQVYSAGIEKGLITQQKIKEL